MKSVYKGKKRNTGNRQRNPLVLIATEGKNKTETYYFKDFNSKGVKIYFASGNETDPVGIAENLVKTSDEIGFDLELGDSAFCVIDGDLSRERAKQIGEAVTIVKKIGGKVIVSNPCVEVWFLCHFTDSTSQFNSSSEAENRLIEYLPFYKKNMKGLKELLDDRLEQAVKNAKYLNKYSQDIGRTPHSHDYQPTTEVYEIIEKLVKGSKKNGHV